ncbi:hypothetical protein ZOSMA_93G00700 [Zostera marina]|uniref:Mitochondrial transcription termination factor family protein n=1 Tax=Zostera marina TaxID=29655 RepID=A0A0K9NIN7_ZOSMR|nr:hypothetical protein ZOSMA_93G00700 [Zostera marina]
MDELLHVFCPPNPQFLPISPKTPIFLRRCASNHHRRSLLRATHVSLPRKPTRLLSLTETDETEPSASDSASPFREKMLFLDSMGVDLFSLATAHPPILSWPLDEMKSTIQLLSSVGLSFSDIRRSVGMCPEILTTKSSVMTQVLTFLLREAGVEGFELRKVIHRRPRLLVSDVCSRLRPTLYFLEMLGISDVRRHTWLLSCSVEEKFLPRIDFLLGAGLAPRDARSMVRRFPQLLCYSIKENLEPKFDFLTVEMGRDLKELKRFPRYFSFSLPERIKPRHFMCKEKGVFLTLPALLKPCNEEFMARLAVCEGSSPPMRRSPLNVNACNF